jgi:outer membrane protein TolC
VTGELLATKAALERTQQAAEEYKDKLSAAENRFERLKSSTVQKLETRASIKQEEPTQNGSSTPKTEPKEVSDMECHDDRTLIV